MIENNEMTKALHDYFGHSHALESELVQSLWSGYGAVVRYRSIEKNIKSSAPSCIAKIVDLRQQSQHPRGWNTDQSHQRKLSSYVNEQVFYKHFASITNKKCQVPKMFAANADDKSIWILMQDLNAAGYGKRSLKADLPLVRIGIKWLANFHACFFNKLKIEQQENSNEAHNALTTQLWPVGTYWHLSTRPSELRAMSDSPLKDAASEIDKRLNQSLFQTLVHGDAKLANFCIHNNEPKLAAVDFQYVGRGAGIKDLVYFLGSCLDNNGLYEHAPSMLSEYFSSLKQATEHSTLHFEALENEYRYLYPFAWADFERFLTGWSPTHKKLNRYSAQQTQLALSHLAK